LATTSSLTSNWPCPSPLVDVPNWVDDMSI
jgi:hypothetical protein